MRLPTGRLLPALLSVVVLVSGSGALGYRWMTNTRPVSADDAIQRYREQPAEAGEGPPTESESGDVQNPAAADQAAIATAAPAAGGAPAPPPTAAPASGQIPPPAPGVYTWRTEGWEEAGFRRSYPPETQRIVSAKGPGSVSNHHIFSEEHEEWFTLSSSDRGGVLSERRMRVVFGPVTVDRTVVFDPPMLGVPRELTVGQNWQGTWTGPTHGSYTGQTLERRTIRIGDEDVEVLVNELRISMQGESEGEIVTKLWYSPKYGVMAREDGNYTMKGGPGTYRSEYTITLTSMRPRS